MRKFQFRLSPLLRLHEAARDECRAQLAEAFRAEQVLRERLAELQRELANLKQECRRLSMGGDANVDGFLRNPLAGPGETGQQDAGHNTSRRVDVDRLIDGQRYEFIMLAQQETLEQHGQALAAEIERRRQALVAADREVKILEKLRASQLVEHEQEAQKQDIKVLDEVAARGHETEWR